MARYTKRPQDVEAWQVGSEEPMPEWLIDAIHQHAVKECLAWCHGYNFEKKRPIQVRELRSCYKIRTYAGWETTIPGDYIVKDNQGNLDLWEPDMFDKFYEIAE